MLYMLKIELDGHFHGGPPVRPWVARITGPDPKFGVRREFLDPLRDWRDAHSAMSGRLYGITCVWMLSEGTYEVSRTRGRSSKRYVSRETISIDRAGKRRSVSEVEALQAIDGQPDGGIRYPVPEGTSVSRVVGLGTPEALPWLVRDGERVYRLQPHQLYERASEGRRAFLLASQDKVEKVSEREAIAWISR
jgi:hypothetical protein